MSKANAPLDLIYMDETNDDDDVVDLLQVVKPGKPVTANSASDEVDFSADLEAMLDRLATAEKEMAESGTDKPFPDPTPVDHEVDHDEHLDLPGMEDLEKLLQDLGESVPAAEEAEARTPGTEDSEEEALLLMESLPDPDASPTTAAYGEGDAHREVELDDDFLESLQAELGPMPASDAGEDGIAGASGSEFELVRGDDDAAEDDGEVFASVPGAEEIAEKLPEAAVHPAAALADNAQSAAQPKSFSGKLVMADTKERLGPVQDKAFPAQQLVAEESLESGGAPRPEVDMNELDSLVDDVLASASMPARTQERSACAEMTKNVASLRQDVEDLGRELRDKIAAAHAGLEKEIAAAIGRASAAENVAEGLKDQARQQAESLALYGARSTRADETLAGHTEGLQTLELGLSGQGERLGLFEQKLSAFGEQVRGMEQGLFGQQDNVLALEIALDEARVDLGKKLELFAEKADKLQDVERAFSEQAATLKNLDEKLSGVLGRLEKVEQGLSAQAESGLRMEGILTKGSTALQTLERALADQSGRTESLESSLAVQKKALGALEQLRESFAAEHAEAMRAMREALPAWERRLEGVEQSLMEQLNRLQELERSFAEGAGAVRALEENATERGDALRLLERTFTERSGTVEALEKALADQAGAVRALEENATERGDALRLLERTFTERNGTVEALEKALADQAGRAKSLEEAFAEQTGTLRGLEEFRERALAGDAEAAQIARDVLPVWERRLNGVEQSLMDHLDRLQGMERVLAAQVEAAAEQSQTTRRVFELGERAGTLEGRFTAMQSNLEKLAAEAAARVIREEISALLEEQPLGR